MPIAICFVKDRVITPEEIRNLATAWAADIQVDVKDVCLTFVPHCVQGGQQYQVLTNLYLPSLWSKVDVRRILLSLVTKLTEFLQVQASEVFIMTSIVQSGHVVEDGQVVDW